MSNNLTPVDQGPVEPVKTTATKAVVGAVISAAVAGVSTAITALEDGTVTTQEWLTVVLAVLVSLGGVFGGVYAATNRVKG